MQQLTAREAGVVQILTVRPRCAVRLLLIVDDVERKFVTIFVGKDNSFYLHPHRPPGEPWRVPDPASTGGADGSLRLHFPSFRPSGFALHKITYHPSGFIHLTDRRGARRRDGIRGPSFDTMKLPYDFASVVPCLPSRLPAHRPGNEYRKGRAAKFEIVLPQEVRPFHMVFTIVDAGSPPSSVPGPYIRQPVNVVFAGHRYGLAVTMWPVKSAEGTQPPDWPPFAFFIMRTAAGAPAVHAIEPQGPGR